MLFVFHVDSGRMMNFDMNLALENVEVLKDTIERHHAIPANSQVLLVSGGETLESDKRVCNYSAGTDTNPIYMFSTTILDSRNPPAPWPSIDSDTDLKNEVDRCLELPATYQTVVRRAQLAQQIFEMGREELKMCEKLVHEQHLQHQGWMAVIANMEDITDEFRARCDDFDKRFDDHIERRIEYKDYLENFDEDLEKLSQIPILPPLLQAAEEKPFHAFDDVYADNGESFIEKLQRDSTGSSNSNKEEVEKVVKEVEKPEEAEIEANPGTSTLTLLQWISSTENQKSLKRMAENCTRELEVFDKNVMDSLQADIMTTEEAARRDDMKEIKGLEERLRGLENLMCDARKIVQEQNDLAQAFQQNQNRAANLGDASILPDLCASHRNQLVVMLKTHKKLRDIRVRCGKAKDELGKNLYQRLKFVIHIENKMYEIDSKLLFYHRCLRRLQKHLSIIEQIHQAPCIYVQAVNEVVRRRIFSTAFLMWASDLACHLLTIYNEEILRRQEFKFVFEGHFLNTLFPGIEDIPPQYATIAPTVFDSSLPHLTKTDLDELSNHLPDLTEKMQLPNLSAVIEFFSSRSHKMSEDISLEENINPTNKKLLNVCSQAKDYERGFESETDTEEYEKINQLSIDKPKVPAVELKSISIGTMDVEMSEIGICTDVVEKVDAETITEVRQDHLKHKLTLQHSKSLTINNDKLNKGYTMMYSKSLFELGSQKLPSIKELTFGSKQSSTDSDIEVRSSFADSRYDQEFINSEFYIDESLPSSLNSSESSATNTATNNRVRKISKISNQKRTNSVESNKNDDDDLSEEVVITLLQDNLATTRSEVERLKQLIVLMHKASSESLTLLKEQIKSLKDDTDGEKQLLQIELDKLVHNFDLLTIESKNHERELVQRLTVDHELEMNDLKTSIYVKDDEIQTLKNEILLMEVSNDALNGNFTKEKELWEKRHQELVVKVQDLEKKLLHNANEREMAVKKIKDEMKSENKNEIESLRCKFKLMTSMERSPSEMSLEKIERDVIDISYHEQIVSQLKEDFEADKEKTVRLAVERVKMLVESTIGSPSKSLNQETFRRILDEKERQLDQMRERAEVLSKSNIRFQETIRSLTDVEINEHHNFEWREKLDSAQREKARLERELDKERSKRVKLNISLQQRGGVTVNSCSKDDLVMVVWDSVHELYSIVQESSTLYFLHAESITGLNLTLPTPFACPLKCYCIGRVTEKEYCHAKKDENRYKVSKGTKFYRVRVRPRSPINDMETSTSFERKRSRRSTSDSLSETTLTRSVLTDSFAQTDVQMDRAIASTSSSDMVDSGVDSQQRSMFKDRNISVTEDEEALSLGDERFRYKSVSEEECENIPEVVEPTPEEDKKEEEEEEATVKHLKATETASLEDSDEYRSLETKDDDTEL